jgi:hypothetical protein
MATAVYRARGGGCVLPALAVAALAVLACGCVAAGAPRYTCDDGSVVTYSDECPPEADDTVSAVETEAALHECDKIDFAEDKYACYTNSAIDSGNLTVCERIGDNVWKYVCYKSLNATWPYGPIVLPTTLPRPRRTTTTTSTTTTTTLCGNGVIDAGEDCDPGKICPGGGGICGIIQGPSKLASCLVDGRCDWNHQVTVAGAYNMGQCMGCYGTENRTACTCIQPTVINGTSGVWSGGGAGPTDSEVVYHNECEDGLCRKVEGKGTNKCSDSDGCRHFECVNGKCIMVRSPGMSLCASDATCSAAP